MKNKETKEPIIAWHFLPDDGMTRSFDGERKRTKIEPGKTLKWKGKLRICRSGLHASVDILDALWYAPGACLCRVECSGEILEEDDKFCCTKRKCLWMIDATRLLHEFVCWCAEQAAARECGTGREVDPGVTEAVQAKRDWLDGKITDADLAAVRTAAWDTSRNIAWHTTRVTSWNAAKCFTWDIAWPPNFVFIQSTQREKLLEMIEEAKT